MVTTAIATNGQGSTRALILEENLKLEADQRKLLNEYVKNQMIEGQDFGVIPGTQKPTLLKPGAEKLTKLFRTTARFNTEKEIEDWDKGLFYYRFKCLIEDATGNVVAEGIGSANSREARYRWRTASRVCPLCGKPAITKSKYPPRENPDALPGWYCFGKKGGCGANFPHDDQSITGQVEGRIENPDIADCINTLQKIAKKRALVDATLGLSLCSDLFTQDLEDTVGDTGTGQAEVPAKQPSTKPEPKKTQPTPDDFLEILKGCTTPAAFQKEWDGIPPAIQKILVPAKEAFKARFAANAKTQPQDDPPQADHATGDGDPEPEQPFIGQDLSNAILADMNELGIDWTEIRDNHGKGLGLADLTGFQALMDVKLSDLSPEQGLRLNAELKRRVAEKRDKAAARKPAGKQPVTA